MRDKQKAILKQWVLVDAETAAEANKMLPARCICGRWGSVYASETYLSKHYRILALIVRLTLGDAAKNAKDLDVNPEKDAETDDLRKEVEAEYRRFFEHCFSCSPSIKSFWYGVLDQSGLRGARPTPPVQGTISTDGLTVTSGVSGAWDVGAETC